MLTRGFRLRPRVPFIPQMEAAECGAASLAMVMAAHGHHVPLLEVRKACGVSRDGASALAILHAARRYGFEARGVRVDPEDLSQLPLPAILHWEFNHFLVLEKVRRRTATLTDPATGRATAPLERLDKSFTGVALVVTPGKAFTPRPAAASTLGRYAPILRQIAPNLGQVVGASLLFQMVGLLFPVGTQLLLDRVISPRQTAWLWGLGLGLGTAAIARALLMVIRSWIVGGIQITWDLSLMTRFLDHLLHLPLDFFHQRRTGDLIHRMQSNAVMRDLLSSRSVSVVLDSFFVVLSLALLVAYDRPLGSIVLLLAGVRMAALGVLRNRIRQIASVELATEGRQDGSLLEALTPTETVRATEAERRMLDRFSDSLIERVNQALRRRRLELTSRQLLILFDGLILGVICLIGGRRVAAEQMTVGVFGAFLTVQQLFLGPLDSVVAGMVEAQLAIAHLFRLDDVMETPREPTGSADPGRIRGGVSLERVSFRYAPTAPLAVRDVTLSVRPGEKLALVGSSGAGKTTLAHLLLGAYLPTQGSIRFDGRDLRELDLPRLRRQLGVVLQEPFLFDDTVWANIALPDVLPLERIKQVAKLACIDDVIEALPQGYLTRIGENGKRLSAGQRQRLCLARALAHGPAILLLDEATSALDTETEAQVHSNLASLGCTRIVIAHRMATVRDADRILLLEDGQIVEEGPFRSLARRLSPFPTGGEGQEFRSA